MIQIFAFGILLYVMAMPQLPSERPFGIPGIWTFSDLNEQISNLLQLPKSGKETVIDIITSYGYPSEVHYVETEDGFILELHRIPHGKSIKNENAKRPVVFLQHCLLCSSADWIINSPDKSLGYILADQGFDVWIGNARGNTYSRRHKKYSPRNKKFWDFSWDEIAMYDLPASIDYVLNKTNETQLNYVGFSMGTIAAFAMMSEIPQYNKKVKLLIALGPVAFLENMEGLLSLLTGYADTVKFITDILGVYEVLPSGAFMNILTTTMCNPAVTNVAPICDNILLSLIGLDTSLMDKQLLPRILAHTPAGTSVQNMIHFMQAKNSGRFQMYSYGPTVNVQKYGSKFPPSYNLNKTEVPVALLWSDNDWFANTKDVSKLMTLLPNVIFNKTVPDKSFSHVDFLWSNKASELVYPDVLELLDRFNTDE